jgi:hypothetical protein
VRSAWGTLRAKVYHATRAASPSLGRGDVAQLARGGVAHHGITRARITP